MLILNSPSNSMQRRSVMIGAFSLALAENAIAANDPDAQPAIPEDNLAYPVLITLKNGSTGSGFFLNTSHATYLVTANHVISDPFIVDPKTKQYKPESEIELLSYSKDPSDTTRNRMT